MVDLFDEGLIDEVCFIVGLDIKVVSVDIVVIWKKIDEFYGVGGVVDFKDLESMVFGFDLYEGIEIVIEDDGVVLLEDLLCGIEVLLVICFVNLIIIEVIWFGVFDIYI